MIKSILCDLGNVIAFFEHNIIIDGLARHSDREKSFIQTFFLNSIARKKFDRGKIDAVQFFTDSKNSLNLDIGFKEFSKIWSSCFLSKNAALEKLLRSLKGKYRLVLLSNTDEIHFNFLKEKYGIMDIFDDFALSYEVGYAKPHPIIYLSAIKKAKAFPSKIVYIDDIPKFVRAARFFGIKGLHYTDFNKLEADLRRLKVEA